MDKPEYGTFGTESQRWLYARKTLEYLSLVLLLVGALNWGLVGFFKFDLVAKVFGKLTPAARVVYSLVGLSALLHAFSRDYYLPFLGPSVYPCGSLTPKVPKGATHSVTVFVKPGANVIFWAAEPPPSPILARPGYDVDKVAQNPWLAYDEYANAGVSRADARGRAVLRVRSPGQYRVPPFGRTLESHVHYRVCDSAGMLSPVQTVHVA